MFGFIIMGKELLADLNLTIFKIWLDTRPKMEIHDPNVYPTILGGVSRGFWGLLEALGARSAIFWHLKTGQFDFLPFLHFWSFWGFLTRFLDFGFSEDLRLFWECW